MGKIKVSEKVMVFEKNLQNIRVLGLFLVGIAIYCILSPYMDIQPKDQLPLPVAVLIGTIFFLFGLFIFVGHWGFVIDKNTGIVKIWITVIISIKNKIYLLKKFDLVRLVQEEQGGRGCHISYQIKLAGQGEEILLAEENSYDKQVQLAKSIAKFTGFSMTDTNIEQDVVKNPDSLNESVQDRIRKTGERSEIPPTPKNSAIHYRLDKGKIQIAFSPRLLSMLRSAILPLLFLWIIIGGILGIPSLFSMPEAPWYLKLGFPLIIGSVLLGILYVLAATMTEKTLIEISPTKLTVIDKCVFSKNIQKINVEELQLLQITLPPSNVSKLRSFLLYSKEIVAQSDKLTLKFGGDLKDAELHWLLAVIENMLAA